MSSQLPQHKIIPSEKYLTIKLVGELTPESVPAFEADIPNILKPGQNAIFQCENLSGLSPQWVRGIMNVHNELKKINRQCRVIGVSPTVLAFFKTQGVDNALKQSKSLRDALVDMGVVNKKALDTDFINPFLAATLRVLEVQAKTKGTPGKIYVKKAGDKFSGDVSGVIGLVCEAFSGTVVISFPEASFLSVVNKMFGSHPPITEITKEIEDAAAELTNIIFGQAKVILNEKGYGIKTALPSVITGKDHSVSSTVKGVTVVVPFDSDSGKFFVEISTSIDE